MTSGFYPFLFLPFQSADESFLGLLLIVELFLPLQSKRGGRDGPRGVLDLIIHIETCSLTQSYLDERDRDFMLHVGICLACCDGVSWWQVARMLLRSAG